MLGGEMVGAQLDHFAGADEQHVLLVDAGEDALRQAHRGGGHGHRIGADGGGAAHFLGHREGALEQLVQQRAHGAGLLGGFHRLLELAENLGFAQHHGIQPAGDAEGVLYRVLLRQRIKIRLDGMGLELVKIRHPLDRLLRLVRCCNRPRCGCRWRGSPLLSPGDDRPGQAAPVSDFRRETPPAREWRAVRYGD